MYQAFFPCFLFLYFQSLGKNRGFLPIHSLIPNSSSLPSITPLPFLDNSITSENVAKKFGISRKKQDEFAVTSHQKATLAQKNGWFKEEIVPVSTLWIDPKSGEEKKVIISADDGIRTETTYDSLAKLKPAFSADGYTTAGKFFHFFIFPFSV